MFILSVVGARPQFIKAATVSRAISMNSEACEIRIAHKILHTGQHYDERMSDVFFRELEIPVPDYNLRVGSASHGKQTGRMMEEIEDVLLNEKPDCVVLYGDTNSTLAGAIAAVKLHMPVAHVEAGLRSFNRAMPEEINRILSDHVAALLFCPTETAVENLRREGITQGVHQVGDVMFDSILFYRKKASEIETALLQSLRVRPKSYRLATIHRAENTDDMEKLRRILGTLGEIATWDCPVVLPLHPRTAKCIDGFMLADKIRVIAPVSYTEMVALESNAATILTDSGGVQKEAYFVGVPCVTLRDETEWVETVESGWNTLAGTDPEKIRHAVSLGGSRRCSGENMPYGDGRAAERICDLLLSSF